MKWLLLIALGGTGCLTIHVHVPPPQPVYFSPYPYGPPSPAAIPGADRRPIDESLAEDQRVAQGLPPRTAPLETKLQPGQVDLCDPPYRVTPQGIRVMRAECITDR